MPVAKILNLWNRTVGVVVMLLVSITGLILMTACHDIATYCAAQILYYVGFTGHLLVTWERTKRKAEKNLVPEKARSGRVAAVLQSALPAETRVGGRDCEFVGRAVEL